MSAGWASPSESYERGSQRNVPFPPAAAWPDRINPAEDPSPPCPLLRPRSCARARSCAHAPAPALLHPLRQAAVLGQTDYLSPGTSRMAHAIKRVAYKSVLTLLVPLPLPLPLLCGFALLLGGGPDKGTLLSASSAVCQALGNQ